MIAAPAGFQAAGVACGVKPAGLDLALVVAERPGSAAGVFTRNRAAAAPVRLSRAHLAAGLARAVVINAGCANAATGEAGDRDAAEMARAVARELGCAPEHVVVASTGVIGTRLPMPRVLEGIRAAAGALCADGSDAAAEAILTTDTHPKQTLVETRLGGRAVRVAAMAKGAGMIAPNMATLLAVFTTDAAVAPPILHRALVEAVDGSLNRISVDGDTSTNDMAVVLASGASGAPRIVGPGADLDGFREALGEAARRMALAVVRDGEGATRIAEIRVEGARTREDADRIARAVAESPLVKTALHGGDPNWGRVLAAAGRAGVAFGHDEPDVWLGEVPVAERGAALSYDEARAHAAMTLDPVVIRLRLRSGDATGWLWTCDLSRGYVDVNAHYRS